MQLLAEGTQRATEGNQKLVQGAQRLDEGVIALAEGTQRAGATVAALLSRWPDDSRLEGFLDGRMRT